MSWIVWSHVILGATYFPEDSVPLEARWSLNNSKLRSYRFWRNVWGILANLLGWHYVNSDSRITMIYVIKRWNEQRQNAIDIDNTVIIMWWQQLFPPVIKDGSGKCVFFWLSMVFPISKPPFLEDFPAMIDSTPQRSSSSGSAPAARPCGRKVRWSFSWRERNRRTKRCWHWGIWTSSIRSSTGALRGTTWVCLKMLCTPLYPMVLLIIIPMKNGYFIGNINPTFSDKPTWWIMLLNYEGWLITQIISRVLALNYRVGNNS